MSLFGSLMGDFDDDPFFGWVNLRFIFMNWLNRWNIHVVLVASVYFGIIAEDCNTYAILKIDKIFNKKKSVINCRENPYCERKYVWRIIVMREHVAQYG